MLAWGGNGIAGLIVQAGAVAPLVELLRCGDAVSKAAAAGALRILAYNNDANAAAIKAAKRAAGVKERKCCGLFCFSRRALRHSLDIWPRSCGALPRSPACGCGTHQHAIRTSDIRALGGTLQWAHGAHHQRPELPFELISEEIL
jgi:hypothetical protein